MTTEDAAAIVAELRTIAKIISEARPLAGRYLTKKEAGSALGLHPSTIARWIAVGHLPVIKIPSTTGGRGGTVRIDREDIDRIMQAHKSVSR